MNTGLILFAGLLLGFIAGKIYTKRKNRVQCINCGSKQTEYIASVYGGGKGKCDFAVRIHECHLCNECDEMISVNFKLNDKW